MIEETDPSENDETLPPALETLPTLPSGSETSPGQSRRRRSRKRSSRTDKSFEFRCPETERLDDREESPTSSTRTSPTRRAPLRKALRDAESNWRAEHYDWTLPSRHRITPEAEEEDVVDVVEPAEVEDEEEDEVSFRIRTFASAIPDAVLSRWRIRRRPWRRSWRRAILRWRIRRSRWTRYDSFLPSFPCYADRCLTLHRWRTWRRTRRT